MAFLLRASFVERTLGVDLNPVASRRVRLQAAGKSALVKRAKMKKPMP
jgi:hypothetical protein